MSGITVYTNKDEALKKIAENHFEQLEDVSLMGKYGVKDHESKLEWIFDSVYDAIVAANYLSNYFEYCHRF